MLTYDSQVEHRHDLRDGGHLALVAAGVAGLDVSEMVKRFSKEESSPRMLPLSSILHLQS